LTFKNNNSEIFVQNLQEIINYIKKPDPAFFYCNKNKWNNLWLSMDTCHYDQYFSSFAGVRWIVKLDRWAHREPKMFNVKSSIQLISSSFSPSINMVNDIPTFYIGRCYLRSNYFCYSMSLFHNYHFTNLSSKLYFGNTIINIYSYNDLVYVGLGKISPLCLSDPWICKLRWLYMALGGEFLQVVPELSLSFVYTHFMKVHTSLDLVIHQT
jgi:hypothetical protein